MAEHQEVPLRAVRDHLGRHVDAAFYAGKITIITKSGTPRAALVPLEVLKRSIEQQDRPV